MVNQNFFSSKLITLEYLLGYLPRSAIETRKRMEQEEKRKQKQDQEEQLRQRQLYLNSHQPNSVSSQQIVQPPCHFQQRIPNPPLQNRQPIRNYPVNDRAGIIYNQPIQQQYQYNYLSHSRSGYQGNIPRQYHQPPRRHNQQNFNPGQTVQPRIGSAASYQQAQEQPLVQQFQHMQVTSTLPQVQYPGANQQVGYRNVQPNRNQTPSQQPRTQQTNYSRGVDGAGYQENTSRQTRQDRQPPRRHDGQIERY